MRADSANGEAARINRFAPSASSYVLLPLTIVIQCISGASITDQQSYFLEDETSFQTYGVEYAHSYGKNSDGYISWLQVSARDDE